MPQVRTAAPRQRRSRLSREDVAAAALVLADSEGVDALTMRRLADRLGVGTMTLYGYFPSKRALLEGVMEAAVEDVPSFGIEGAWRPRLRELVIATRQLLVRHPSLVEIRTRQPILAPEAFRLTERAMAILLEAGFAKGEAARAFRLLFVYIFGFAALSPAGVEEESRAGARAALMALSPDEYPTLAGVVEEGAAAMGGDSVFEFGLDLILDGLAARLDSQPSARP